MPDAHWGPTIVVDVAEFQLFAELIEAGLRESKRNGWQLTREQHKTVEAFLSASRASRTFGAQQSTNGRDLPEPTAPTGDRGDLCMMPTMTTKQVSERIGVSTQRVDTLRDEGRLEARKDARGRWQFPTDGVDAFLKERSKTQ